MICCPRIWNNVIWKHCSLCFYRQVCHLLSALIYCYVKQALLLCPQTFQIWEMDRERGTAWKHLAKESNVASRLLGVKAQKHNQNRRLQTKFASAIKSRKPWYKEQTNTHATITRFSTLHNEYIQILQMVVKSLHPAEHLQFVILWEVGCFTDI